MPDSQLVLVGGNVAFQDGAVEFSVQKKAMLDMLRQNLKTWREWAITNYSVTVEKSCFCLFGPYYGPNRLSVRGRKLVSAAYRGERRDGYRRGDQLLHANAFKLTIDEMFSRIENLLARVDESADFAIEYDPTYGFPILVAYDEVDAEDEEFEWRVRDFVRN